MFFFMKYMGKFFYGVFCRNYGISADYIEKGQWIPAPQKEFRYQKSIQEMPHKGLHHLFAFCCKKHVRLHKIWPAEKNKKNSFILWLHYTG